MYDKISVILFCRISVNDSISGKYRKRAYSKYFEYRYFMLGLVVGTKFLYSILIT